MSRIYRKDEIPDSTIDFEMPDLTGDFVLERKKKETEFKADEYDTGSTEFIPGGFDFNYEGGLRRDEIISKSLDEAEEILAKAKVEAEKIIAGAEAEGFEVGRQKGYEAGLKEAAPLIETFTDLAGKLTNVRREFYENSEQEIISLVIDVVKVVIGLEMDRDPSLIKNVIRKATEQIQSREHIKIVLNPEDLAEAEEFSQELAQLLERQGQISFESDPGIVRGGCMVETNIGSIDARVGTQLEAIRETFIQTLNESKTKETNEDKTGE